MEILLPRGCFLFYLTVFKIQQASLEGYISTSVMLQYNSCFHGHGHNHYYIMSSIIRIIGRIWRIIDTIGRIIADN